MPGNQRQITADAERQFLVRIAIRVPGEGLGRAHTAMSAWLDEHCGVRGWTICPAGTRGVVNDAIAVWLREAACGAAFVARWCVAGDRGCYQMRDDELASRIPLAAHKSPP